MSSVPVHVVAALFRKQDEILIFRRGPQESGAGSWEFPGGKVEVGETSEEALQREIREELSVEIKVGSLLGTEIYAYPGKTIRLEVYWAQLLSEKFILVDHDAWEWIRPDQLDVNRLSAADRPFLKSILQIMSSEKS